MIYKKVTHHYSLNAFGPEHSLTVRATTHILVYAIIIEVSLDVSIIIFLECPFRPLSQVVNNPILYNCRLFRADTRKTDILIVMFNSFLKR